MYKKLLSCLLALILLISASPCPVSRAEETRQLVLYWQAAGVDYDTCDVWIWFPGKDGRGYLFEPCDYGVKVTVEVPADVSQVGFIVRRACSNPGGTSWGSATKDFESDRFAELTGPVTEVYLKEGDGNQYMSDDGGRTLYQDKKMTMAGIVAMNQIQYFLNPAARIENLADVRVTVEGRDLAVTDLSSLNNNVITGTITLAEDLDLTKTCTVEVAGYGSVVALPTKVFDSDDFQARYTYTGDDLGATLSESGTCFKVWAPTASRVRLRLYENGEGGDPLQELDMTREDQGVWTVEAADCGSGTYYTYLVATAAGEQEAVDPYARAVGVNGNRGMVVRLTDTDPEGFGDDTFLSALQAYNEAVIWEVHVRDFSNTIATSKYPGKYLAFTEHGLTGETGEPLGIDYLTDLGITHVHLQPVYDYATVDESSSAPQFNWGYDPKNYNVPEGSYSTDAFHGEVRITEFKQMVQALHEAGFGVVMDVVYNHTYDTDSCLNRIVPYYYYRLDGSGGFSNGSGCGNETASERAMFRKYMVESVSYWAREYHVDGFRFDLMALHDVQTMQEIEQAVHAINPHALLYGEGWTGGTSPLRDNLRANQANIHLITASEGAIGAVAVFNDATRDGLKGSVFDAKEKGYISGNVNKGTAQQVIFGLTGGERNTMVSWGTEKGGIINYMACHDNHTLFDRLEASNGDQALTSRLKMNRFGISILMLGQGVPFFLAGEEMLRSKGGDSNSYASSDEVNNLRWDALATDSDALAMRNFYRDLIALRKANDFITRGDINCELLKDNVIRVEYSVAGALVAVALINPTPAPASCPLPEGQWHVLLRDEAVDLTGAETVQDTLQAQTRTVTLVISEKTLSNQITSAK